MNYSIETEKVISSLGASRPSLLLHSCCGVCSSYVLEYLSQHFDLTVFFFNPNIYPNDEYLLRRDEQIRLIDTVYGSSIRFIEGDSDHSAFLACTRGLELEPEGKARCSACFELRLSESLATAKRLGSSYLATTLTVSPHKNAEIINRIGERLCSGSGVLWLPSDFKKKDGYLRSARLAALYSIYRQNYCGCEFSLAGGDI